MAATPSIRVIKQTNFRGVPKLWSNRYHFNGGTPADSGHWTTFSDLVVNAEKSVYDSQTTIVKTIGYAAGSDVPVFTKTYSTVGTGAGFGAQRQALEVCGLIRYSTTARTPKNHPVYLFNYVHAVMANASTQWDQWNTVQQAAAGTYASSWITGFSDGTNTYVRAGPNGATAVGQVAETNLTHRDFPR